MPLNSTLRRKWSPPHTSTSCPLGSDTRGKGCERQHIKSLRSVQEIGNAVHTHLDAEKGKISTEVAAFINHGVVGGAR